MYISIVQLVIQRDVMVIVNVFGPEVEVEEEEKLNKER